MSLFRRRRGLTLDEAHAAVTDGGFASGTNEGRTVAFGTSSCRASPGRRARALRAQLCGGAQAAKDGSAHSNAVTDCVSAVTEAPVGCRDGSGRKVVRRGRSLLAPRASCVEPLGKRGHALQGNTLHGPLFARHTLEHRFYVGLN